MLIDVSVFDYNTPLSYPSLTPKSSVSEVLRVESGDVALTNALQT